MIADVSLYLIDNLARSCTFVVVIIRLVHSLIDILETQSHLLPDLCVGSFLYNYALGFPDKRVDDGNGKSGSLTPGAKNEHPTMHDIGYNSGPTMAGAQRDQTLGRQ